MPLLLGCVADDFTGATDLASTLVKAGMSTVQLLGVPRRELAAPDCDAPDSVAPKVAGAVQPDQRARVEDRGAAPK